MRVVGAGHVHNKPEWSDCCWPGCMGIAEGGGPPLCQRHVNRIIEEHEREKIRFTAEGMRQAREESERRYELHEAERLRMLARQSQVYYVRIGDHVKIGYTINLRQRLGSLRVDEDALLATEPGARELETQRHREFAAERVGRRENFNPSRRLLEHIEKVKVKHGPPTLTTYPRVLLDTT